MVTIKDIAKQTGYSKATVSRVLNNHPYVSDEVRRKIQAVIAELNYTPNLLARELSAGKTNKIAVVIPNNRQPYFTDILNGMLDESSETNHDLLLLNSNYDKKKEQEYLEQLRGHAFDGIIFTSRELEINIIESYAQYGPILLCEPLKNDILKSVYIDRNQAYLDLHAYLVENDVKSVAYLFARADDVSSTYRSMMSALSVFSKIKEHEVFSGISSEQDSYEWAKQIHKKYDAIVTNDDLKAYGVINAFKEKNEDFPLIVGQGNYPIAKLLKIPTIENYSYELGRLAIRQLLTKERTPLAISSKFIE